MDTAQTLEQIPSDKVHNTPFTAQSIDVQESQKEYPRQGPFLRLIRMQGPDHRHWQAQDQHIGKEIRDAAANGNGDQIHTLRNFDRAIPERGYRNTLEDCRKENGDVPGSYDATANIQRPSKRSRDSEDPIVEDE